MSREVFRSRAFRGKAKKSRDFTRGEGASRLADRAMQSALSGDFSRLATHRTLRPPFQEARENEKSPASVGNFGDLSGNRHVARTARARLRDGRSTRGLCNRRDHSEGRGADRPVCSPRWARARRSRVRRFRGARRPGVGAGAPPRHGRPPGSRSRASRPARVGRDRTTRDARGLWEASPRPRRPREGPRASRSRPTSETSLETSRRPRASAAPRGPPPPASGASGTETETNSWMTSPCSSRRRWRS